MTASVERLMHDIEDDVRQRRRRRLLARGGAGEYRDPAVYDAVDRLLRRAVDARDNDARLLPEFLSGDADWQLSLQLPSASHRRLIGPLVIAVKRRIVLPLTRWLYEYSRENFRRQRRINDVLFACIEELAIENARLRRTIDGGLGPAGSAPDDVPAPGAPPSA